MKPPPTTLVTLVDRVLLPAASLAELPDLSIEPLKVQELILDYLSEQDCPGAVAHLQRELGKSSRQPQNNHSASRLVQLVAKGLIHEKNVPRLDSILQGCNDIMKSVEDGPAHHSIPQPIPQNFISNSQSQQQPPLRPQPRHPQTCQLNPVHSSEGFSPGRGQTSTSESERPPLTESRAFNVLPPSFPASFHQTAILPLNSPIPGIGTSCSMQSRPFSPAPNFDTKPRPLDSISHSEAQHADSLASVHTLKRTFHQREQNDSFNATLDRSLEQPPRSSSGQSKQPSDTHPSSDFSRTSKMHLAELGQTTPQPSGVASSFLGPPAPTNQIGPNGGWPNTDNEAVCLSPARRFSASIPQDIDAAGDEAEDVKPDLRRYLKQKTPPSIDGTALLNSPRISSKRTGLPQVGRGSPPSKKPRINGQREDTSARREESSKSNHFPLACQTSSMLYGLSDADLPGTPPEMSPHTCSRTLPESARSDREPPYSSDRQNPSKAHEDESAKDLSDVGTPRGSPPEIAIPSVDFDQSLVGNRRLIDPMVMTSGDELKDLNVDTEVAAPVNSPPAEQHKLPTTMAIDQALAAPSNDPENLIADIAMTSPSNPPPPLHSHTFTASIGQARRPPEDQRAPTCQVKVSNSVSDSSTAPSVAIMEELRAKLLASRKLRSTTVPIPTPVMAPAPAANIAPSEPSHHVSLSLEQNLRAQLRSRQAVSPADNSQVGQSDELEDGQIATPPPEEESKSAKVMLPPTIKHPLPLKPVFLPRALNNPNSFTVVRDTKSSGPSSKSVPAMKSPLDIPSPPTNLVATNGAASSKHTSLPFTAKVLTPLPISASTLIKSSAATVRPFPMTATLNEAPQTASSPLITKESDSLQQLRALKEREADLAAELSRKKELLKSRHQLQRSNPSFASTDKSAASVPTSGASITVVNSRKSPVFDGAKRHERASAVDTFNMVPEIDHVDEALSPVHGLVAKGNRSETVPGAPRFVEDFFSSLQQQFGAHQPASEGALSGQPKFMPRSPGIDPSLIAFDDRKASPFDHSIVPPPKLNDATRPTPFTHLKDELVPALDRLAQHLQTPKARSTDPALPTKSHQSTNPILSLNTFFPADQDTARKAEGGTASPSSESCVSSAESSVEIFLEEKMDDEFGDAEGSAPDSTKTNSRDERSGAAQDLQPHHNHPWKTSEHVNHSRQLSDHSICKAGSHCNDTRCGLTHCSPAAQNGAPSAIHSSLCYHASDCRDSLCSKVHPRVPTPTLSNSASLSFRTTQTCRYDKQCLRQDCHFKHSWQQPMPTLKPPTSLLKNEEEAASSSRSPRMTTSTANAPGPSSTSALSSSSSHVRDATRSDSLPPLSTEAPVKTKPHKSISPVPPLATIPALSPAPVQDSEIISHPLHGLTQPKTVTRAPAGVELVNGACSSDAFKTSRSPSLTSPSGGNWLVADQLEQYANSARGLRDLSGSPQVLPPSIPTTSLPDSFPLAPLNKFSSPPLFPSFPSCFDGPKAIPLPPPSLSAFTPFDNTDLSLPAASTSSSSRPPPQLSPDIDAPSDIHVATKRPSAPNVPPTPSNARRGSSMSSIKTLSSRDERRMKNGKLRDPANPSNLLVPPIVNDLLLGVKKLGQKQVQADLEHMRHEDPTGARSERLGNSVLTSIGWMSPPDRMASKPLSPATFTAFLKQSNLPIPYGLPNEMQTSGNLRRMWQNVLTHPLAKNIYRYCQELVQQRKRVSSFEDGGSASTSTSTKANGGRAAGQHAGLPSKPRAEMTIDPKTGERISPLVFAQNRIDHITHNLVIPIRIIGHVASKSNYRKEHF